MNAADNYAEIYAEPGDLAPLFFIRCCDLARTIKGTVYATFNGTRVAVTPTSVPKEVGRDWLAARGEIQV